MSALFVVATPLGNLEDLSPRALRTLREADLVACEDTRRTGRLLSHFGVSTPLISFHEHNEETRAQSVLKALREGKSVALVSDAGTPLISDPGYSLVRVCRQAGFPVIPIPGPCAAVAALSACGLPTDRFLFVGFPARKASALRRQLEELAGLDCTLVFYLSPHRLGATLSEFARQFPERDACLFREMTKIHETCHCGTLAEIAATLEKETPRGEYTLAVAGGSEALPATPKGLDVAAYVAGLQSRRGVSRSEAIKLAAVHLGLSRREVYNILVDADQ